MLSRSCDGCEQMKACAIRYQLVDGKTDRFVYCPSGIKHLVDGGTK